ncbi:MAG TPA: beta-eliminating lyase-related protein, partial [Ktedonobacterales bacterium]
METETSTAGTAEPSSRSLVSAQAPVAAPADDARQAAMTAALDACERFVAGHGPQLPRAVLARLAEEAGPEERIDRYGAGALITDFEHEVAGLLGKEAAVFMPSGTMAQQIALRIWSERRGTANVAFHPTCHLALHERKGYEYLHGLRGVLVGDPRRMITLADLEALHEPLAALLLELPQREIGGQLPEWDDLWAQVIWARERDIALHMDGARLWESGPYYDRTYAEIAGLFDTVYVSCYKGLGGIAGALLCGPEDFIAEARVWQRRHGGNLVSLYPLVLSARRGLRERLDRFPRYRRRAVSVARALSAIPGIAITPDPPQTNMMHVYLRGDPHHLLDAALDIARTERVALFAALRPTDVPGWSMFELSLGDAVEALTDDEISALFRR